MIRYPYCQQVWDANVLQAACTFSFPQFSVHAVAMSSCATGHCLIAATTASPEVRLCDPNSGSFSHSLTGHTDGVWAAAWSLQNEWELITGGCDGQVGFDLGPTLHKNGTLGLLIERMSVFHFEDLIDPTFQHLHKLSQDVPSVLTLRFWGQFGADVGHHFWQARLWDIRAPGAVRLLNQHQTERKRDRKGRSR